MNEWMLVSENPPKETQPVIFVCKNGDMFCGKCFVHNGSEGHKEWLDWIVYGSKGRAMRGRVPTQRMPRPELPEHE